ncbi:MAG TPA: flagellar basal body-associated FliL family protein [Bacteroidetes bacterium]|nr:flagellar basal body-associated FliL family protein [Bacteroidota bacterium]
MAEEENEKKKKKSFSLKKIIIIVTPLLVIQLVLSYFFITSIVKPKNELKNSSQPVKNEQKKQAKSIGQIYMVEDVIVNPKETGGRHFINVSIGFDCVDSKTMGDIEKMDVKVRDYLISLFSNSTISQLDDAADKDTLRIKIMADVNNILPERGIQGVYFTNFILQ